MDRALLQFLAIAEQGSISGAAASLSVTQPTLTFNMKKLEQGLGVELFQRSSRGMVLTRYGETLYEHASVMRRLYNNAVDTIERQRLQREESLNIGSGFSWWTLFLRQLVLEYGAARPQVLINVSLSNTLRCMDQLLAGDIILYIGHRIDNLAEGIRADFLLLGMVRDGFFVRSDHPLLATPRTQSEIARYPSTVALPPEARLQRLLLEPSVGDPRGPQSDHIGRAFTSNSLEACLEYVISTDAVLRHTNLMAPTFLARGIKMVEMAPGEEETPWPVGIYVLPERRSDKRVTRLIGMIQAKAAAIIPAE